MGAQIDAPVGGKLHAGASITREELTRDDSLIQYLSLNNLYGVSMGKKDRNLIARGFVDVSRLVNISFFWVDVSNPFPWASGSWPVSGPTAFTGRELDRRWHHRYRQDSLAFCWRPRWRDRSPPSSPARILFIGNSLTYSNDLPRDGV